MLPKWHYAWRVIFLVFLTVDSFYANDISFIAIADNRNYFEQYRAVLQEINDLTVNPEPLMPYPFFLVACGDIDPVDINMAIYNDTLTYPDLPPYYPVVGNHGV